MKVYLILLFFVSTVSNANSNNTSRVTGNASSSHGSVTASTSSLSANAPCDSPTLTSAIPRSPMGATSPNLGNADGQSRDNAILREVRRGNIPNHLRQLKPVVINNSNRSCAGGASITICVMPDYLSVGTTDDNLTVPLGRDAAVAAAAEMGFILPTTALVDNIYRAADVRLSPSPRSNYNIMTRTSEIAAHHQTVQSQLRNTNYQPGMLVAGSKKDTVITNRMLRQRDRIAIYGWHRSNGRPIQSLSLVHGSYYTDYSQAVRMISQTAFVNGSPTSLKDLLGNDACAAALVGDGNRNSRGGAGLDSSILSRFPAPTVSHESTSRNRQSTSSGTGID